MTLFNQTAERLHSQSVILVHHLDADIRRIMLYWVMAASLACGIRITVTSPHESLAGHLSALLPYALVVAAPVASLMLARSWFRHGETFGQPHYRFARLGRWRPVSLAEARKLPLYGASGLMASLVVGILINVPVRSLEFLAAIPAVTSRPVWLGWLSSLMLADVVLFTSLYGVAFVAALRRVPLFPRLLATIWLLDITMQSVIYHIMNHAVDAPAAVDSALQDLLTGNIQKVLISAAIWGPYLLFSRRVNLTFRHRIPA